MAKFTVKAVTAMKSVFDKAQYVRKEWKTDESCTMTLSEYAEYIDPIYNHIVGNPQIVAKERKDGGIFLKMLIQLEGGESEFDLSYENEFEEGDEIDKNSLLFCIEKFLERSHGYVTGNVI